MIPRQTYLGYAGKIANSLPAAASAGWRTSRSALVGEPTFAGRRPIVLADLSNAPQSRAVGGIGFGIESFIFSVEYRTGSRVAPTRGEGIMMEVQPWKGAQWGKSDNFFKGIKLLVLGESAYYEDQVGRSPPDMITGAVDAYLKHDTAHYGSFHSKLTTVLAGKDAHWQVEEEAKMAIWASIMLWNYVFVAAAGGPRKRPTAEMFRAGRMPFDDLMAKYQPRAVLVCGYATWGWLMYERSEYPGNPWETPENPLHRIESATMARMRHPSGRGFKYREARPILAELLSSCSSH
jgi:hypothetical protein